MICGFPVTSTLVCTLEAPHDGAHMHAKQVPMQMPGVQVFPRVINMAAGLKFDIYIGRRTPRRPASKWANPYHIGSDGSREVVIRKFRAHLLANQDLRAALPELEHSVLGCYCYPQPCHGDVLVEFFNHQDLLALTDAKGNCTVCRQPRLDADGRFLLDHECPEGQR